jgi:hypothetical protein
MSLSLGLPHVESRAVENRTGFFPLCAAKISTRNEIVCSETFAMHAPYGFTELYKASILLHIKELVVIGTRAMKARVKKRLAKLTRLTG